MSEKEKQDIDKAFSSIRKQQGDALYRALPREVDRSYAYKGSNYEESVSIQRGYGGVKKQVEESIHSDDASIDRSKRIDNSWSDGNELNLDLTLPTTTGKVEYSSKNFEVGGRPETLSSKTVIVRKDKDGNEVYRFKSQNPEMADKVGAIAAKRIIEATASDHSEEVA